MKRFSATIITMALTATIFCLTASAQGQITTKKNKLSDFTAKTTRIVLTGNEIFDRAFELEISRRWNISPFEFCPAESFDKDKTSPDYYYLIAADSKLKKETEPGISVLTVFKGGNAEESLEIISLPYASSENPSGREFVFLPALIDIIQRHISDAMVSDRAAYGGLERYSLKIAKAADRKIYFSKDDLSPSTSAESDWEAKKMYIVDEEEADEIFSNSTPGALVSYMVAPDEPQKGSACYKMLISADTHELFYFDGHKLGGISGVGFLPKDTKLISLTRKK